MIQNFFKNLLLAVICHLKMVRYEWLVQWVPANCDFSSFG